MKDGNGQHLAYLYFEDESQRRMSMKRLISRRGIPNRGEHRQAAKRAAADIEGHSATAKFGQPRRLSSPSPFVYHGEHTPTGKPIMRGTILLVVLVIAPAGASAQGKIRLAQTSVTTTCMMTCNSQYALCQSSCLASGTQAQSSPSGGIAGANVNANQSCLASCTNIQLQCQINTCARASPSR